MRGSVLLALCTFVLLAEANMIVNEGLAGQYEPTWESLDARPLPKWFDNSKFGIFIHWGVFSVPSWGTTGGAAGEWYWWNLDGAKNPDYVNFHLKTYGKDFKYQDFAPSFKAELFDPAAWAKLFKASGAKYVVLTSKHHEGFCNWPTKAQWNWDSMSIGPHKDLVKEVSDAVRKEGLTMGLYHSLFEWFHPLYLQDKANNYTTTTYVDNILLPQLKEIVTNYQPDVLWADGAWDTTSAYWKSKEFLAWLYNDSPVKDSVVVNDRWGSECSLKHGGYYSGDDRFQPGGLLGHKWESCATIDTTTWGYKRNSDINDYMTPLALITDLCTTVAFGGNYLLNVGPTHDGVIVPTFQERLLQIGAFLDVNGEAIYESEPWRVQNETVSNLVYTQNAASKAVYAVVFEWPESGVVKMAAPIPSSTTVVTLLGYGPVTFASVRRGLLGGPAAGMTVTIPAIPVSKLPNPYAFALKIENVQ